MKKQYVVLVRDHSGSMYSYRDAAMRDYNSTIADLKKASAETDIDTIVFVIAMTSKANIKTVVTNSSVNSLKPLTDYPAGGGDTPLFDAVHQAIVELQRVPDALSSDVSFLVLVTTDGEDNSSERSNKNGIAGKIRQLQATDRWTFAFRTPRGGKNLLAGFGIPGGNVQEWEQTERGFEVATHVNTAAISNFYQGRATRGITGSSTFYADAGNLTNATVKRNMTDISGSVTVYPVKSREMIQPFMEDVLRRPYLPGTAFYQLSKTEKVVQASKGIILRNKNTGAVYAGQDARDLLNLPDRNISLKPGDHGDWDIFIQSTSNNRILLPSTSVVYWAGGR